MKGKCGSISSILSMIRSRCGRTTWLQIILLEQQIQYNLCNLYTCLYILYHIIRYDMLMYSCKRWQNECTTTQCLLLFKKNDACEAMSFVFILQAAVSRDCNLLNTALSNHATFTRSQMHLKIRV